MRMLARSGWSLAATFAVTACTSDGTTSPGTLPGTQTITVDASQPFAYVAFGDPATVVNVTDASASTAWDVRLYATAVTLNGGAAGPGDVSGYCLCQNSGATAAELRAMTPASQLAAFEAVTASQVPASGQFMADLLSPVIAGWYTGTAPAVTAAPSISWILRRGTTATTLGKFRVTTIENATTAAAGSVTFEYALQGAPGGEFGPVTTRTVSVGAGVTYFDLTAGTVSSATAWDLAFTGYTIRTNGGVSGAGGVMAVPDNATPFAAIDAAYAATAPSQAYRADEFGGVFTTNRWYRYNLTGTDNQIWPTYDVYLLRKGSAVYKVQLTGYYGSNGAGRQVTLRYRRLK
ncbi:MAG: hypothetical protein MNPFHGCM_01886 [Gemmatimonadaceae bacterium]|nr:hypothetical protein [Gemmatimonadaceae bacterium]